jgi:hypothetical protein
LLYNDLDELSGGMPEQYPNLTKNNSIPNVAGGILWQDEVNKVFWLYGGEFSSAPEPFQLWGYDLILNQWNLSSAPSSPIQRVSYGAGVAISESGRGFYYGGYLNNLTNPLWNGPQIATSNLSYSIWMETRSPIILVTTRWAAGLKERWCLYLLQQLAYSSTLVVLVSPTETRPK